MVFGLAFLGLAACGAPSAPAPPEAAAPAVPHERLGRVVERYWDEHASRGDAISPQQLADSLAVERRFLAEVLAVPRAGLDAESRLTYDIFKRQRELEIEGFTYPDELLPVNPFDGPWLQLARSAADTAQHPLRDADDCENWLRQIDGFAAWSRQAIANMREGMRRGYTSPRSLVRRALPLLALLGEDTSASVFYLPMRTLPQTLQAPQRSHLTQSLAGAVKDKLLPAYRELHDFMQNEYLPRTRESVALSTLPLGPSWYAFLVKRATDSALPPGEIHAVGLEEVARLQARLASQPPGVTVGALPKDAAELVAGYRLLEAQVLAAMPGLFADPPPVDFEIRAADSFMQAATPLMYRPAAPGGGSALLYVNMGPGGTRAGVDVSGFMQEAIPGRHYQSAIAQARSDLPKFRRFGTDQAFVDGWALYAASLGEELGVTRDDEARRSVLFGELRCAVALVVDTGLHAMGWTRRQASDYLHAQLTAEAADADLMIDRFAALPGDALACKMGELKIRALRNRAQSALGARFDPREFHSQILKDGAMPLDILEAKIRLWIEGR